MPTIGVSLAVPEPWGSRLQDFRVANGDARAPTIPTHITLVPPLEVGAERARPTWRSISPAVAAPLDAVPRPPARLRHLPPGLAGGVRRTSSRASPRPSSSPHDCRRGPLAVDLDLPLPPARDGGPPPRRGRLWTAPSTSWPDFDCTLHGHRVPPLRPRRRPRVEGDARLRPGRVPATDGRRRWLGRRRRSRAPARGRPWSTTLVRMQEHYGQVNGAAQAGAVTYYAFLSFFPILALAFFVGRLPRPGLPARPGQPGRGHPGGAPGHRQGVAEAAGRQISISSIESAATTVGMHRPGRRALRRPRLAVGHADRACRSVFEMPRSQHPNFLIGKLRDLVTLVDHRAHADAERRRHRRRGRLLRPAPRPGGLGHAAVLAGAGARRRWSGCGANMLLFYALFRLLARPADAAPRAVAGSAARAVWASRCSSWRRATCSALTQQQPAFQAFGIALVLLIWINYFSRIVMYAAAWAHTSRPARAARDADADGARYPSYAGRPRPRSARPRAHRARPAAHLRRRRRDGPGTGGPGPQATPLTASESGISHDPCTTCRRRAR